MSLEANSHEALLSHVDDKSCPPSSDTDEFSDTDYYIHHAKQQSWLRRIWRTLVFHGLVILSYTAVFAYAWSVVRGRLSQEHAALAFAPYTGEYESKIFQHEHSIYVGFPSEDLDEAWQNLLTNANIRITESEMDQIPGRREQAIHLPDGGYYASPNVFHNLHCIKRLYQYMYPEYYFPNITLKQQHANEYHSHHCLDMLRQSVMCSGDMQLLTMKWNPEVSVPTANFTMPHRCVNWEKLDEWATSRRIANLMSPGYLTHPVLGPAYPGGRGDIIGETGSV